jgi:hypothetical protein
VIKTNKKLILTIFVGIMLFANLGLAIPIGHQFHGTVTINGNPAPDNSLIQAKIDDKILDFDTTTLDGNYNLKIDLSSTYSGKTIYFYVDGNQANEDSQFCLVYACSTRLDLTAAGGEQPSPPPSGPGGGSPGGIYIPPTEEEEEITEGSTICQEEWTCSDWSVCEDGLQTRTCEDVNNCGTRSNEPFSTQPCSTVEEEGVPAPTGITGLFLTPTSITIVGLIVGVVIIISLIYFFGLKRAAIRKKK